MSQQASVQPVLIERPPCPQCGAQMMVARIRPHTPGSDERTYQCSKCRFVETLLMERRACPQKAARHEKRQEKRHEKRHEKIACAP